jgi:hypothetical protein
MLTLLDRRYLAKWQLLCTAVRTTGFNVQSFIADNSDEDALLAPRADAYKPANWPAPR